ncbi:putative exported protein [Psychrobacter aquaticus CMS 56]|uniref:Putative exported protein n=2 Tax=Psychrobacter TaxID=497 RepID=U4T1U4_9GAMM|nr:putative exported protein [Psychrobacter aquaticus CMS 56]
MLDYAGTTFLVDPMLAPKNAYPGFADTVNSEIRYPMVDLPMSVAEVLKADAIILTHLHADHWDDAARNLVPRNMPIFTQDAADAAIVRKDGFTDVRVLTEQGVVFKGTRINKTIGQHGTDEMYKVPALAQSLGKTMGLVFQKPNYKTVYVAGDTIWDKEVEGALTRYKPDAVVLNAGYAKLTSFDDSIIMGKEDVYRAYKFSPNAQIISVHMDTVNHATLTKAELRRFIEEKHLDKQRSLVPNDGQVYKF